MELRGKYNTKLQNAVYMSTRQAAKEMGSSTKENVGRWYRELQYYGFIVMESGACLGVNGMGKAAHYRLTEEFHDGRPPTRDYLNWDGELFHDQKPPSYYRALKKQKPVSYVQDTLSHTYKTVAAQSVLCVPESVSYVEDIQPPSTVSYVQDITSLTTAYGEGLPIAGDAHSMLI
jgi:hypothetical protein